MLYRAFQRWLSSRVPRRRTRGIILVLTSLAAFLAPPSLCAADHAAILVFLPGGFGGPFYSEIFSAFRSTVDTQSYFPVTVYPELLDLDRFKDEAIEGGLSSYLRIKYQGEPIGVIVAIGARSLEFVMRVTGRTFGAAHPWFLASSTSRQLRD